MMRGWRDHPASPLIHPRRWSWIAGDPTVLLPDETPDHRWHLFANQVLGVHHYVSADGLAWRWLRAVARDGVRAWVRRHGDRYHLYYQRFRRAFTRSHIVHRTSRDLEAWSPPQVVLAAQLPWEGHDVGNPCLVEADGGGFWLYYSASSVFLADMGLSEPEHVGRAWSACPEGPFERRAQPVLGPEPGHPCRNRAAGAIKVYRGLSGDGLVGFANGIYRTAAGRSASAILLLRSGDGLAWEEHPENPLIGPTDPVPGWKRAHVYQLDVRKVGDALWLYYNARDGWLFGVERIGLAILDDARQLWDGVTGARRAPPVTPGRDSGRG